MGIHYLLIHELMLRTIILSILYIQRFLFYAIEHPIDVSPTCHFTRKYEFQYFTVCLKFRFTKKHIILQTGMR